MVIALAGRRIDSPQALTPHFPPENVPLVRERLRQFFLSHPVTTLVSSAACGADILALSEAVTLGIRCRVVLPFPPHRFRETSVSDRTGDWQTLYDDILATADAENNLLVLSPGKTGHPAYSAVNSAIVEEAIRLARQFREDAAALLVWNGISSGASDLTQAFGQEARTHGLRVFELSTTDRIVRTINP
jgi:hypothetical protein